MVVEGYRKQSKSLKSVEYLNSGLGEVHSTGQLLSGEDIGIVCLLKHSLQLSQLEAVEVGPVTSLLLVLAVCRDRCRLTHGVVALARERDSPSLCGP